MMAGIGSEVRRHNMTGSRHGGWKIDLVIEKQELKVAR